MSALLILPVQLNTPPSRKRLDCLFQTVKVLLSVKLLCDSFTQSVSALTISGVVSSSIFAPTSEPLNFDLHSSLKLMTYAVTLSSLYNWLKFSQQIMLPRLLDPLVAGELHMRLQCLVLISFKHSSGISKLSSSNSVIMSTS